jgi:hypothetical protein
VSAPLRRGGRRAAATAVAAALLGALLLGGCAGKPPSIARVYARPVYQRGAGETATARLSVFLVANDPDGIEDLSAFYVINDDAELFWKVDSSSWIKATAEGETWIGTNALSMPDSGPVPPGTYRVVLEDQSGETTEMNFDIPVPSDLPAKATYPTATVSGDAITVSGPYASYEVWTYAPDGTFLAGFPVPDPSKPLEVSRLIASNPLLAQGFTARAYAYNERGGYAVLSDPVKSPALQGR